MCTGAGSAVRYNLPSIRRRNPVLLIEKLTEVVPRELILDKSEDLSPFECDGLAVYRQKPKIAVLAETVEQVSHIMKTCHELAVPVVARGAGTGLSGGALPHAEGVLLCMSKFDQVCSIDPDTRTATVQPGVRNLAISEAAAAYDLYYAPDPSSQIACSIGGNIAENAGGVHCLKYGLTVHNLLGLKVITAEGELFTLGGKVLDDPGYDLLAIMTGSEGMLGVIVEATVRLLPIPEQRTVMLAAFDDVCIAGDAVAAIIAAGIIPSGLEMMDSLAIQAAESFVHAGYPTDAAAILLCELDGNAAEIEQQTRVVQALLQEQGASSVRLARDQAEMEKFWSGRKASFPAVGRMAPDYYCMDGTIPRNRLGEVLASISELSERFGLAVANVFHAGDGNLHPLILYDSAEPGELEKAEQLGGLILERCVEAGGTITGEHGVGIEKINQMCVQFSEAELEQFHRLKAAFDVQGILNPGKAVPTLARCPPLR